MLKRSAVIIYDCDGVLFDSRMANEAFYNHILHQFGMPSLSNEQLEFVHVSTTRVSIDYLFRSTPWLENAREYIKAVDNAPFIPLLRMEPHVKAILRHLRPSCHTAIATNRGLSMPLIMKEYGLDGLFDLVVTALDVRNPKPHPECILKILAHFKAEPDDALYVGDSEVDRLVSEGAAVPFVSYKNQNLRARYHINDHRDILKMLPSQSGRR